MLLPNCQLKYIPVLFILLYCILNPVQALQCYKCDSLSTPNCAIDPSKGLQTSECPVEDSMCAMAVYDLTTYRGCSSDIQIPDDCTNCKNSTCTGDLCNGGIYPENRIKCFQCEKEECVTVTGTPEVCLNYNSMDYCYIDVIDETDVIRGCISDDGYNAGVYTKFCREDGCNNSPAVSQFTCLSCDSDIDDDCKHGDLSNAVCKVNTTNICMVNVLYGRSETCYTFHNGERVVRGCSRLDPDLYIQSQYISTCRNSECNSACVKSPTCYVCDSDTDTECMSDQLSILPQDCPFDTTSCFTCRRDGDSIVRGCGGNRTLTEEVACLTCWNQDGCNSVTVQTCYQCNSATDKNCATWQNATAIPTAVCSGSCIAKITDDDYTVRGCKSGSLKCAPGSSLCKECDGDNCNGEVYPENRQICYQCDESDTYCDFDQSTKKATACYNYQSFDSCFQSTDVLGHSVRGCTSDFRYYGCRPNENTTCNVCPENGCNSKGLDLPLQCSYCDSKIDDGCGWAQINSADCKPKSENSTSAACYTHQVSDGEIIRGCMSDSNACDPAYVACELCAYDDCNDENVLYQECIQCSGKIGEGSCAQNAENMESTRCPADRQYYENRGCYVKRINDDVFRGCLMDMNSSCEEDKYCIPCYGQKCNYQNVNSANHLLGGLWIVPLASLYAVWNTFA